MCEEQLLASIVVGAGNAPAVTAVMVCDAPPLLVMVILLVCPVSAGFKAVSDTESANVDTLLTNGVVAMVTGLEYAVNKPVPWAFPAETMNVYVDAGVRFEIEQVSAPDVVQPGVLYGAVVP